MTPITVTRFVLVCAVAMNMFCDCCIYCMVLVVQVRGFPSIKMFASGKKDGEVAEYDGGRTANDIVTWAVDKLGENVAAPENKQVCLKCSREKV